MAANDVSSTPGSTESFDEFRNSFSYGARADLFFKWFKTGTEQLADEFLQELLELTGNLIDNGDPQPIVEAIVRAQASAYAGVSHFEYDTLPFAALDQPVSESRIALLTTTGHFAEGDDPEPFGMVGLTQDQVVKMTPEFGKADPTLSEIPITTTREQTRVRHPGYDVRPAAADRNTSFPIDRMLELENEGVIGKFVNPAYSFVGLASQLRLKKEIAPAWAARANAAGAQGAVLVPVLIGLPRVRRARSEGVRGSWHCDRRNHVDHFQRPSTGDESGSNPANASPLWAPIVRSARCRKAAGGAEGGIGASRYGNRGWNGGRVPGTVQSGIVGARLRQSNAPRHNAVSHTQLGSEPESGDVEIV